MERVQRKRVLTGGDGRVGQTQYLIGFEGNDYVVSIGWLPSSPGSTTRYYISILDLGAPPADSGEIEGYSEEESPGFSSEEEALTYAENRIRQGNVSGHDS